MAADISSQTVKRFIDVDLASDRDFSSAVELASSICNMPFAFISLLDEDTQYFKVRKGITQSRMPRKNSFCNYVVQQEDILIVPDTLTDKRFAKNPMVTRGPRFRFYAGAPLINNSGQYLGILAVLDKEPRELNNEQHAMLTILAAHIANIMEMRVGLELLEEEHKQVEEQEKFIEVASIRLRSFFESSPNFHVLLGRNGEVIDFNKVAFNFIKRVHHTDVKAGDLLVKFIAPDFVATFLDKYEQTLQQGQKSVVQGSTDYGSHGIIWWEANFEPASDNQGNIIGMSYLIRNISEQKEKEQKILEQNQSLLDIAHIQAHEFRAPLTTIMGLLNLIKEENNPAPTEYFELLNQAVNNLDVKIRDIVNKIEGNIFVNSIIARKEQNNH
jgi:PAS domain S-box-containing protein